MDGQNGSLRTDCRESVFGTLQEKKVGLGGSCLPLGQSIMVGKFANLETVNVL